MNITKLIKDIMTEKGIKITQLNDMLNEKNNTNYTPQNLGKRLKKDDIKFSDAEEILNILGYSLEIVPNRNLKEVATTTIDYSEEHEEEELKTEAERVSDLFQGTSYLDSAIDSWLEKHIQQRIEVKSKEFFEKVFPSPTFSIDGDDFIKRTTKDNEEK